MLQDYNRTQRLFFETIFVRLVFIFWLFFDMFPYIETEIAFEIKSVIRMDFQMQNFSSPVKSSSVNKTPRKSYSLLYIPFKRDIYDFLR